MRLLPDLRPTGVPTHKAFLYAAWRPIEPLTITPSLDLAGDRWSDVNSAPAAAFPYVRTGGYTLINLSAEYEIARDVRVVFGFKNLSDDYYELAWGFPQSGRTYLLEDEDRTMRMASFFFALLALTAADGLRAAQAPAASPATLTIVGDVGKTLTLTSDDLRALPRSRVEVKTEDGTVNTYEGVFVGELLKRAGAPVGAELRGNAVASYVVATASDGYQVLFSLAELDPAFTSNDIIVADTVDGKPLFAYQGPFRIVAPKDLRGARSIRMLQRIEVVRLRE